MCTVNGVRVKLHRDRGIAGVLMRLLRGKTFHHAFQCGCVDVCGMLGGGREADGRLGLGVGVCVAC